MLGLTQASGRMEFECGLDGPSSDLCPGYCHVTVVDTDVGWEEQGCPVGEQQRDVHFPGFSSGPQHPG